MTSHNEIAHNDITHTCTRIIDYLCMYIQSVTHTYTRTHNHTHTYTHTHMHTHTHMPNMTASPVVIFMYTM